nr:hypothetical protein BaRGS_030664 [Batillaria attramentaria]
MTRDAMSVMTSLLAFSLASLLLSSAVARTIKDERMAAKPQDTPSADSLTDPRLSQLLQFFVDSRRNFPRDDEPSSPYDLEVKRSWEEPGWAVPTSMKRKMFWTPLGHLPASARLGRPQALRPHIDDSGSAVFRYG